MSTLLDINHNIGGDVQVTAQGDLALAGGLLRRQQRILRRLLTNPGDYLWHPDYGAGLKQFVGSTSSTAQIVGVIQAQLALEAGVGSMSVSVQPLLNGLTVSINYTDTETNQPTVLSFEVNQ
jgi:phage baseplate assembly protein W